MKFKVKGTVRDLLSLANLLPGRRKRIAKASSDPIALAPLNKLAKRLHPKQIFLKISEVRDETATTRTFRMVADGAKELPFFRAGQYLSVKTEVGGVKITRPYSISSSPRESLNGGFYELSIRKKSGGFLTEHIWENWKAGTKIVCSGPHGFFYYEPLRDGNTLVGLAGGCGITPFRSIIKDIIENDLNVRLTLLYGTKTPNDIVFASELNELAKKVSDRFKIAIVASEPDDSWRGDRGFLSADFIREQVKELEKSTFFICGPPAMYRYLDGQMKCFQLPRKKIRREVFGEIDKIIDDAKFPAEAKGKTFEISVHYDGKIAVIPAKSTETVLVALEKAGLNPQSQCRSGECGFCRSLLRSGKFYVVPENDGRRFADKKFGYFHPCASYPLSDLEIEA